MNFLYQLVYTSQRNPACTDTEIQNILESCKRNNPSKDITGVLLHSDDHFIQYLEGDKDIIKLYDLIKEDSRHRNAVLLSYGPLKERAFPSWHMGYKNLPKDQVDFLTESNEADRKLFNSIIKGEKQSGTSATNLLVKFFNRA
ncbi:BLUF domain-containing protein [Cesiribacter sp. SM1]|uniref:BLUF domain-containing protein n=1 Tax=Cesiribacter sp. SM1 TaxID=2861196 RepID=UPI001CD791E8|nr:BLUF domain-containing protein [Cesiribacter sp. SM1]